MSNPEGEQGKPTEEQRATIREKSEGKIIPPVRKDNPKRVRMGGNLAPEIRPLPGNESPIKIVDGDIKIDSDQMAEEYVNTRAWLTNGILEGDEKVLAVYLRNVTGDSEEEEALHIALQQAFEVNDPTPLQLDALHVNIPTAGIAQRNLIRQGLQPEIARHPFSYYDDEGNVLSGDDLDIVFARSEQDPDKFKLIVGSKKGIASVGIPKTELQPTIFKPDLMKMHRDEDTGAIKIPLGAARDKTIPSASGVEIRKGPINILEELEKEENELKATRKQTRGRTVEDLEDEQRQKQSSRPAYSNPPTYSPPAPRQYTSRSSEAYGYTRVSG